MTKTTNRFIEDIDKVLQDPEVILVLNIIGAIKKSNTFIKDLRELLILKNNDCGNSALEPMQLVSNLSPIEGIRLRINDKLNRMICDKCAIPEDTVTDTGGYYVLLKIAELRDFEGWKAANDKQYKSELGVIPEALKDLAKTSMNKHVHVHSTKPKQEGPNTSKEGLESLRLVPSEYDPAKFETFNNIQHQKLDTGVVVLEYFKTRIFTTDELVMQLPYPTPKKYYEGHGFDSNSEQCFKQYRKYLETQKETKTEFIVSAPKKTVQELCDDVTMGDCLNRDSAGACDICTNQSRYESRAEKQKKKRISPLKIMKAEFTA